MALTKTFMFSHTIARGLLLPRVGRTGSHSEKTNKEGVFYYTSCKESAYILGWESLTVKQKGNIDKYVNSFLMNYYMQGKKLVGFKGPMGKNTKNIVQDPKLPPVKKYTYEFYIFDGRLEYSVLEKFTSIRRIDHVTSKKTIDSDFKKFCEKAKERKYESE